MDTYELMAFRNREFAREYIKFQGWDTKKCVVRMYHNPSHKFANERGNVAVIRIDKGCQGKLYLFSTGDILPISYVGQKNFHWID